MTILSEILSRRGRTTVGFNPNRFVELEGADAVPVMNYEPDPVTFRSEYYYNSRQNALFRKLTTEECGESTLVWKRIGG